LVDRQGNIEFPVLGLLRVEGLTKQEVAYQIKNRLRDEGQINDAVVTVDIMNFKITVIGEVGSPGIQNVTDEKITIFEAIIRAGGVMANGAIGEIQVFREDRRGLQVYYNDLRTIAILDSPTYYLQQNDIVYVKPRVGRMSDAETRIWSGISTVLGFASALVSIMILYNYYK